MKYLNLFSRLEFLIPLFLFIFVFIWVGSYTIPFSVTGDGWTHATIIQYISDTGNIAPHLPNMVLNSIGARIYSPISYSELFHVIALPFYLLGGLKGLAIIPPIFSALTSIFVYLLLRKTNKFLAIFCSLLAILINITRIALVIPAIEDVLLLAGAGSIFFYYKFLKNGGIGYLFMTSLFLAVAMSVKQSGFILAAAIFLYSLIYILVNFKKQSFGLKKFLLLTLVTLIFLFGPITEQISRNGTLDFVPANSLHRFPFMTAKYIVNPEAMRQVNLWLGPTYWPKQAFPGVIESYFALLLSQREVPLVARNSVYFLIFLFIIGSFYAIKKNLLLSGLLLVILFIDILSTYITQTLISAYHVVGLIVLSIFIPLGLFYLDVIKTEPFIKKIAKIFLISFLIIIIFYNNFVYFHNPILKGVKNLNFKISKDIQSYKKICGSVHEYSTSYNSLSLGYAPIFRLYCKRDIIWLNQMYNIDFIDLAKGMDENKTIQILKKLNVAYIIIENNQVELWGYSSAFPKSGLLSYIDSSSFFMKIYDDNNIRVWKVIYE